MPDEASDLRAHLDRVRSVTLQYLDRLSPEQLAWRPGPDVFSCGQHLLHIAQAEEYYARGLFEGRWEPDLLRLPRTPPSPAGLRARFAAARERTASHLASLPPHRLAAVVDVPGAPAQWTLRSWLWFLVEHETHHKAQLAVYLRQMGLVAPFYALPLPAGERPDIEARRQLGGV